MGYFLAVNRVMDTKLNIGDFHLSLTLPSIRTVKQARGVTARVLLLKNLSVTKIKACVITMFYDISVAIKFLPDMTVISDL